ncbi:hypothetical protein ACP0AK_11810 [Listeria ivanovii]|uniref:hypothetical protein n=1 Tax=Listeria ivanovii TaxID=1638 RepID=UPI0003ECB2BD|nr:hypothetical protein [Listeria ivanovii]AHI54945.1 hypothetical protein AX25_02065 [Listeria ivanovii WSLC3009]AIS64403.1 hypothetical protein JL52_02020 [Listeria ivanovii subsp. ivanovii]MBC1760214.1 hypothetical protein [Listeria ivanovii]PZF87102.1 hypothetical protein C1905_13900 [Listeria ivanovii]PZF91879.1 hypothetical protein C1903_13865 [Listeria ivanovii]
MGVAVLFPIFLIFATILGLAAKALLAIWVYKDAEQRGMNAILWCILMVFVNVFIILVIYLIIRRKGEVMKSNLGLLISGIGVAVVNTMIVIICLVGFIFFVANDGGMHNMMDGHNYDDGYNYDDSYDYDTDSWNDEL